MYSLWRLLATATLNSENSICVTPTVEHSPVHTSVFLHHMCASCCLSAPNTLHRAATGIIIPTSAMSSELPYLVSY